MDLDGHVPTYPHGRAKQATSEEIKAIRDELTGNNYQEIDQWV